MPFWIAGGAIVGGLLASDGAKSAAKTQSAAADRAAEAQLQAARESNQLQGQIFDRQAQLQEPFRATGLAAQNRLMTLLGLAPITPTNQLQMASAAAPRRTGGGGLMAGGVAGMVANAVENSPIGSSVPELSPIAQYAVGGDPRDPAFGSLMRDFSMADFQADPGYQFRQDQGMQAIDRLYGGRQSGRAMKDAMRFNQGLADQSYQDAFNRFQTNRANKLQPLQSLAGLAQSSSNAIGSAADNYGTNVGNTLMGAATRSQEALMGGANARASSYLNQGTNWANTVNQLGALGARNWTPNTMNSLQASFSQTPIGGSGFGTGLAYGNQDLGSYI